MENKGRKATHKRILLGVSGSIAAYKSADIVRRLRDQGWTVDVVMTQCAQKFITPLTLAALSGRAVYTNMFDDDLSRTMTHIHLVQEVSAILIAPATANLIGKLACGLADDLLSSIVLAAKAKIFIAPAMNVEMYNNTIVRENCLKLKKIGMTLIDPVKGNLACGTWGEGHLADVDDIVKVVARSFK
jgi:phosphopantothenoylcysteine synthetase/decarboxylase